MKNKKIYNLLILLFAFFVLVFFTTNIYSNVQESLDFKKIKQLELEKLNNELTSLGKIKATKVDSSNIKKFLNTFNEADIFKYINQYIDTVNNEKWDIYVKFSSINFNKPQKSELWFRQVKINLSLKDIQDSDTLIDLLDYLTNKDNKYSFFITDFSFPIENSWPYKQISIPLQMYIK